MMKSCIKGLRNRILSRPLTFALAITTLSCSAASTTQSVTVAWNPGTDPGIAGYALYYGKTNGTYSTRIDVGTNTSAVVSGLVSGQTNYFAVSAYNVANLEGTPSTSLSFIVPGYLAVAPGSGMNLTFPVSPGHWYAVQAATNLTASWTNIWQTSTESSNGWVSYQDPQAGSFPRRYYRLVLH